MKIYIVKDLEQSATQDVPQGVNQWTAFLVTLQQVWDQSLGRNLKPEIKGRIVAAKTEVNTLNYFYGVNSNITFGIS